MAKVFRTMFVDKIGVSLQNLAREVAKVDPQSGAQMIRLGLHLAHEFSLLAGCEGGSTQQPDITPTGISERVVTIKNPETLWEDYIKTNVRPLGEVDQATGELLVHITVNYRDIS